MWGKVLIGINRMRCFIELVNLCKPNFWSTEKINSLKKKSFNPTTLLQSLHSPTFISDKLNVSGQIIYFLYWKLTSDKKSGFLQKQNFTSYSFSISCYSALDKMVSRGFFGNRVFMKNIFFFFNNLI